MVLPPAGRPDAKRREPLWDRVDRNRFRLVGYIALFFLVSTAWISGLLWLLGMALSFVGFVFRWQADFGWLLDARVCVGGGALASAIYVWWALMRSERYVMGRLGVWLVPTGQELDAKMALKDMAIAAGMPLAPRFLQLDTNNVNAFVFHSPGRRPALGVTSGLLTRLTIDGQRAVFANLVARIVSRDTMVASAVTALMAPLQAYRDHRIRRLGDDSALLAAAAEAARGEDMRSHPSPETAVFALFMIPAIVLAEVVAAAFRRSQRTAAEKADAEGMLLLKDPGAMLSALETCVRYDNVVTTAGEAYGQLFYCWTGDSTNDEDDPEWRRVARLREVIGVDGMVGFDEPIPEDAFAPLPPRLPAEKGAE